MVAFEKIDLVLQIVGAVVLRCGRKQSDVWICPRIGTDLLYQSVKRLVHQRGTVAEFMALVNDDKPVVFVLQRFAELSGIAAVIIFQVRSFCKISDASCGDEVNVGCNLFFSILVEHHDGFLPSRLDGRWGDDQHLALPAVIFRNREKTLYDQDSDDGLAEAHDIGQHEAAVFVHDADAPLDGFYLVFQPVDAGGQIGLNLLAERLVNHFSELDSEQLDIQLVWGKRFFHDFLGDGCPLQHLFQELLVPWL